MYMFAIWEKFPNNPVFFRASVYTGCSKLYKWMGWTSSMSTGANNNNTVQETAEKYSSWIEAVFLVKY